MRLDRTAIIRYIKKCKNVIECNCVTGDYSMLLEVLFENTMELDRFIGELQYFGSRACFWRKNRKEIKKKLVFSGLVCYNP